MSDVIVMKFGGSTLTSGDDVTRAAEIVKATRLEGLRPVVVVSALQGETDRLLALAKQSGITDPYLIAQVVSLGEVLSATLLTAALKGIAENAVAVAPGDSSWPITTSGDPLDAEVELDSTARLVVERLTPLMEKAIPVICGFMGTDKAGHLQLLGRGGADTTAVVLGNILKAREVVLFKDVDTLFSADPKTNKGAVPLSSLSYDEAFSLSAGGAKVIQKKAFKYLGTPLRITTLKKGLSGGLIITPPQSQLQLKVERTFVISIIPGEKFYLADAVQLMQGLGVKVYAALPGKASYAFFLDTSSVQAADLHDALIKRGLAKALTRISQVTEIELDGVFTDPEEASQAIKGVLPPEAKVDAVIFNDGNLRFYVSEKGEVARIDVQNGVNGS